MKSKKKSSTSGGKKKGGKAARQKKVSEFVALIRQRADSKDSHRR